MKLHIENFHIHDCPGCDEVLEVVKRQELLIGKFMSITKEQFDEAFAKLNDISVQSKKLLDEAIAAKAALDAGQAKIGELQVIIQELQAQQGIDLQPLLDKISNEIMPVLQSVDDVNPDQVVEPEPVV